MAMTKVKTLIVFMAAALCVPAAVQGQIWTEIFNSDTVLDGVIGPENYFAQARIGDLGDDGTYELKVASSWSQGSTANIAWPNCEYLEFSLTFDESTGDVVFTLGGETLSFKTPFDDFDAIFIRANATFAGTRVALYDMVCNGVDLPNVLNIEGPHGLRYMQLYGPGINGDYTLTGLAKLCWDGDPPTDSDLGFKIKATKMAIVEAEERSWSGVKALYR
jgi:hypothetical protein